MRVFVSSTVYDLLDIRAELDQLLRELGISPVMSDEKLSDFNICFDANSIEACLLNIESCDAVIVVLDQRYGPTLGKHGFDDVSATHLEYRHAKLHSKAIYFYVRDRLEADYNIHQKNKGASDLQLSWISAKDRGLLEFLKEHRALRERSSENNWFALFTNVVDLKASIRHHFEPVVKPQVLLRAIEENRFPLFESDLDSQLVQFHGVPSIQCRLTLTNVGATPAFDFVAQWKVEDHPPEVVDIIAPQQDFFSTLISNRAMGDVRVDVSVQYRSAIGIVVRETYHVNCLIGPSGMISGATLQSRTYHSAPPPTLHIENA